MKSFFNLMFQIFFYSFGVYLVVCSLGIADFSLSGLAQCAKATYASWGFISGYVALYFVAPLINSFVEKSSKRDLLVYILVFFLANAFFCKYEEYFLYFLLYLMGKYIRKTELLAHLRISAAAGYWGMTIIIFLLCYNLYLFAGLKSGEQQSQCLIALCYANPFIILQAAFLFIIFGRMYFQSNVVNWLSSSCLSIFLIHMHPSIKDIGYYAYSKSLYDLPILTHLVRMLVLMAGVFMGSILIDKIRIFISDRIYIVLQRMASVIKVKSTALVFASKLKDIVYNE